MIDPKYQSLSALLNEESKFVVPEYQRPYSWKSQEVGDLAEDIQGYVGDKTSLYLGTIILDVSMQDDQIIEIVDGQQRLTTLFLLLIACREHARSIDRQDIVISTQRFISFVRNVDSSTTGMRLVASLAIRSAFEYMADLDWKGDFPDSLGKRAVNKVQPVYEFFFKKLKGMDGNQIKSYLEAVYAIRVIRIDINKKEDAFAIFERTNARGMDLEVADLLKNYLHAQNVTGAKEAWDEILDNSSHAMLSMLKSFYVSQRGYIQKAQLYRSLKKLSDDVGGAVELTNRLRVYSEYFKYSKTIGTNPDATKDFFAGRGISSIATHQERFTQFHQAIMALRSFGVTQTQPLLYAAIECIDKLGLEADASAARELVRLARALESYHFVNTLICKHIGNEVEQVYAKACKDFVAAKDFAQQVNNVIEVLKGNLEEEPVFAGRFAQVSYANNPKALMRIAYIFDRFNNYGRKVSEQKPIFYPDIAKIRRYCNVEHIAPQNPQEGDPVLEEKAVNNIGNLLILSLHLNSELKNKSVKDKFALLGGKLSSRASEFPTIQAVLNEFKPEEWNESAISKRALKLANYAYETVWQF